MIVAALLLGAAGYGYWTGLIGDRPGSIARKVTTGLKGQGLDEVVVTMGKDWVAVVSGAVVGQDQKQLVEQAIASSKDIQGANLDALEVRPSTEEIRVAVAKALSDRQLGHLDLEVAEGGKATLGGRANSRSEIDRAVDTVMGVGGVTSVDNQIRLPFSVLESEINSALRERGYSRIWARLKSLDDVEVRGVVQPEQNREEVIALIVETAAQYGEAIAAPTIRDEMTVAAPVMAAPRSDARAEASAKTANAPGTWPSVTETPPVPQETGVPDGALVVGTWGGRFRGAILPYEGTVQIAKAVLGQPAGRTEYVGGLRVVCRGALKLLEANAGVFVFEEQVTERVDTCPIRGLLQLRVVDSAKAKAQWYRPGSQDKPSYKGELQRRQ